MSGVDHVFVDGGEIAKAVLAQRPDSFDKMLDLVGVPALKDSLRCSRPQSVICMTETVGNVWSIDHFEPMTTILQGCAFDHLWRDRGGLHSPPLEEFVDDIATVRLKVKDRQHLSDRRDRRGAPPHGRDRAAGRSPF
jgi:NADPH:quinone reductase